MYLGTCIAMHVTSKCVENVPIESCTNNLLLILYDCIYIYMLH